jgi:hypothetical protein
VADTLDPNWTKEDLRRIKKYYSHLVSHSWISFEEFQF